MRDKFRPTGLINIMDIKLDLDNFRYYGQLKTQQDCFSKIINDDKANIVGIAEDIAKKGLTIDPIVLSKNKEGDWIVREGNRRVCALRILNNPNQKLCPNKTKLDKIKAIINTYGDQIPAKIECMTSDSESAILEYLDRIHLGANKGIGRIPWTPENKQHFDNHLGKTSNKNALALQVKNILTDRGFKFPEKFPITTLQRFLQTEGVKEVFGYVWEDSTLKRTTDEDILIILLKFRSNKIIRKLI